MTIIIIIIVACIVGVLLSLFLVLAILIIIIRAYTRSNNKASVNLESVPNDVKLSTLPKESTDGK